jgi:NAD+ synthase (glutamine-hydrolysing)
MKGRPAATAAVGASAPSANDASEVAISPLRARTQANLQVGRARPSVCGGDTSGRETTEAALRVALAQIDPTVGDVEGNAAKVAEWIGRARAAGAELAVFPELCVSGYPAEDLYLKRHFVEANRRAVEELARGVGAELTVLVGFAEPVAGPVDHRRAHNSLAVLSDGAVRAVYRKNRLPNYAVFDEQRYFVPGSGPATIEVAGTRVGLTICEDVWVEGPPASTEVAEGAELIANPSGSPYHRGKGREREAMFAERARSYRTHLAFCNLVGGQDELVFDGHSFVVDPSGAVVARAAQFGEELLVCEVPAAAPGTLAEPLPDLAEVYGALVLGLRDYVGKNGFRHAGLALSGGVDSALVALLAVDALGPEHVSCVVMPSPHSSPGTQSDARTIAANLGTETIEIPIAATMAAYESALAEEFGRPEEDGAGPEPLPRDPTRASEPDIAAENIQARIRGNLMMALSNKHGWLVLTTGNKSEMSVGYATLYGDMAGGFAVIKDVPKTLVYELLRHRNEAAGRELVPASVLERAPSAELRPAQLDADSLPPYELLDRVLEAYVERDEGHEEMIEAGMPAAVVDEVIRMVDRAEYKRRQAAPGIRITPKAFGRDRRLPITNRFGG